jgi:hypothetical protein
VRFALEVREAVVRGEVFWDDGAAVFVVVQAEFGVGFAVDGVDSLSFGEQGCCEGRDG